MEPQIVFADYLQILQEQVRGFANFVNTEAGKDLNAPKVEITAKEWNAKFENWRRANGYIHS